MGKDWGQIHPKTTRLATQMAEAVNIVNIVNIVSIVNINTRNMAKNLTQSMAKGLGIFNPKQDTTTAAPAATPEREPEQLMVAAGVRKSTQGRKTAPKEHAPSVQRGLRDGYTRATIIVKAEYIDKLKEIAYRDRSSLRETLEQVLGSYIADYEKKHGAINL